MTGYGTTAPACARGGRYIQERVKGLELCVEDCELHQPIGSTLMDVSFPRAHGIGKPIRGDRHKPGIVDGATWRSDPVRSTAVNTRRFAFTTHARQQNGVRGADNALRQRQLLQ